MSLPSKGICCGFDIHDVSSLTMSSAAAAAVCSTSYHTIKSTRTKRPLETTLILNSPLQPVVDLMTRGKPWRKLKPLSAALPVPPPLDLTEDNVRQALVDARAELGQIFDASVGITGNLFCC